ncbi:MAG: tRNA (guanosine(46)-N7)-methyltransferase TrmB [Clostridiales bacterium]|nr:tRNA (guanosine(46)-N7)-methyltransferase TrmB [Clostridiales bacterium]
MRMRKKKNLDVRLERCAGVTEQEPSLLRGHWRARYGGEKLALELGCGKGKFVTEMAVLYPDTLFIAMEKEPSAILMAMEKTVAHGIPNIRFIVGDAALLPEIFAPGEVDVLYINFADPWTRGNRKNRRLTHRNFLALYNGIVAPGAHVVFKTDNRELFVDSVTEFVDCGLKVTDVTHDLHATAIPNVMTEYETRFTSAGLPIHRVEAYFPAGLHIEPITDPTAEYRRRMQRIKPAE